MRIRIRGDEFMIRRTLLMLFGVATLLMVLGVSDANAQQAYGRQWGNTYNTQDWDRMYHYPYVYYPQNFYGNDYYRSSEDMYYRYPAEMRIPVYHKQWQSFYPAHREDPAMSEHQLFPFCCGERHTGVKYYSGHHFIADVF
jgi:hypothetical protein